MTQQNVKSGKTRPVQCRGAHGGSGGGAVHVHTTPSAPPAQDTAAPVVKAEKASGAGRTLLSGALALGGGAALVTGAALVAGVIDIGDITDAA